VWDVQQDGAPVGPDLHLHLLIVAAHQQSCAEIGAGALFSTHDRVLLGVWSSGSRW
jgi:hypothetical protein